MWCRCSWLGGGDDNIKCRTPLLAAVLLQPLHAAHCSTAALSSGRALPHCRHTERGDILISRYLDISRNIYYRHLNMSRDNCRHRRKSLLM